MAHESWHPVSSLETETKDCHQVFKWPCPSLLVKSPPPRHTQTVSWPCSWSAARRRLNLSADDSSRRRKNWRRRGRADNSSIPRWDRTLWRALHRWWEIKRLKVIMSVCVCLCVCVGVGGDTAGPAGAVQTECGRTETSLSPRDLWPSGCPSPHWQLAEPHARAGAQTEEVCVNQLLSYCLWCKILCSLFLYISSLTVSLVWN